MKSKLVVTLVVAIFVFLCGFPAYAGNASSGASLWEFNPFLRLWGIDMACVYKGVTFVEGLDTGLWLSLGGGVEGIGFYRGSDGTTPYTPPASGDDLGAFTRTNFLWTLGLKQGLVYDQENRKNLVELITYYRSSMENYSETDGISANIFSSTLPDKNGINQNSLLVGVRYTGITTNQETQVRKGAYAETSLEFAPESLNEIADFTRLNVTAIGFKPLIEKDVYCIYVGDRVMFDRLYGDYIPVNARSSLGGSSVFPGITSMGIGGAMRGVQCGRFDGYDKLVNNLDLRVTFPNLIKSDFMTPGIIVYYDMGYADNNLTHQLDMGTRYSSAGLGLVSHFKLPLVELDLGISNDYFITEGKSTLNLLAYLQF